MVTPNGQDKVNVTDEERVMETMTMVNTHSLIAVQVVDVMPVVRVKTVRQHERCYP